jgi:hypothetical protein
MNRLLALALALILPGVAFAAPHARLLEGQTLKLSLGALASLAADNPSTPPLVTAPQADAPPPPAVSPPVEAVAARDAEEAPGLGGVLGLMVSGGIVATIGVIWSLWGIAFIAGGNNTDNGTAAVAVGVVFLVFGIVHLGVGGLLLWLGNRKRVARNEWLAAHGTSERMQAPAALPPERFALATF